MTLRDKGNDFERQGNDFERQGETRGMTLRDKTLRDKGNDLRIVA